MPEPEIARRCSSCGASIRELAFFCPQCGKELARQNPETETQSNSIVTAPLVELQPSEGAIDASGPAVKPDKEPIATKHKEPSATKPKEAAINRPQETAPNQAGVGKVRGRIQRATTLARDVEGDVIHRVQKVREISSVVLDEAGYDPSLRFVLVAAALFVVFLIIVLLNRLIT